MLLGIRVDVISEKAHLLACFGMGHGILVECLADLALKASPDVRVDVRGFFLVLLALEPFLDALEMDEFDGADALAG